MELRVVSKADQVSKAAREVSTTKIRMQKVARLVVVEALTKETLAVQAKALVELPVVAKVECKFHSIDLVLAIRTIH